MPWIILQTRHDFIQLMVDAERGETIYDKGDEHEVEKDTTNSSKVGK